MGQVAITSFRPDLYHGDVSIQCVTEDKPETVQNCTGADKRTWTLSALGSHALVGIASSAVAGNALADPNACEEINNVTFAEDAEMAADRTFCLRQRGDTTRVIGLRVVSYPTGPATPAGIVIETQTWIR